MNNEVDGPFARCVIFSKSFAYNRESESVDYECSRRGSSIFFFKFK